MKFPTLVLLVCSALGAHAPSALELVSFGPSAAQSGERLEARWVSIPQEQRERIEHYLLGLGLSSTGAVQLVGVYEAPEPTLQFQQLDLFGTRLFWTVLVDPQGMRAKVLHQLQAERVTGTWVPIADASASDELQVGARESAHPSGLVAGEQ